MKIIILGAGGIGSLIGALLSKENGVLLVGREKHVNKISNNGLDISGAINEKFELNAKTKLENIEDSTLIILTTKVTDSEKTINQIKDLIKKDTVILCLQNGLGSEDIVKKLVDCEVIRGIITAGTTFLDPGKITCSNRGNIFLEKSAASSEINDIFNNSGLNSEISDDIKVNTWKKSIANCVMNTLTAIFKVENGELIDAKELIKDLIHELTLVANEEGINIDEKESYSTVMGVIEKSSKNKSSMLQDLLKGRRTEIDFLNGKIVELARKHNLEVPINKTLVQIIKFKQSNH